ncbi:MAG: hypothetical protein KatS3mg043_0728 [Rhodothermaceae bacterium]|nr:MAG: hypothetical protein KatS3mg043_0728 [Rhodothermaceae bacterium]
MVPSSSSSISSSLYSSPFLPVVGQGFRFRDGPPFVGHVAPGQLHHLFLDAFEVLRADLAPAEVDVVVEAVFDGRADAELDAGIEGFEGLGHQVGRRVPVGGFALGVVPGVDPDVCVLLDGTAQVAHLPVDADGQGGAGQSRRDALGHLAAGDAPGVFTGGSVGKRESDGVGHVRGGLAVGDDAQKNAPSCRRRGVLSPPHAAQRGCVVVSVVRFMVVVGGRQRMTRRVHGRVSSGCTPSPAIYTRPEGETAKKRGIPGFA